MSTLAVKVVLDTRRALVKSHESPDPGSADFSGEQDKLGEDFHESK